MITIYGTKASSAARCIWTAEELGLEYEIRPVDFANKEHKGPEYLALNPNGKVPTMVDNGFVIWESLAINNYLVAKAKSNLAGGTIEEKALIDQWTLWSVLHLYGDGFHALVMQNWQKTAENDATKAARQELPRWLKILNDHLAGKEYIVGDRFTLADLNVMSVASMSSYVGYDISAYDNVVVWMKRMTERPAYKKVMFG